ncbi:PIG-L family deacetylase [Jatrophihabitans sp.]|uniref:PIG-L family deacetylase n=1 Tax=Jatrophihabitans sp. TaxID=1932789 RepID=UPI0030C68709|nr:LmbE family protein [Jatrophihabitans sp.]
MTDHVLTLMAVHAHPDDEATGTGGLLAKCAAEGIRTVLVTCTDGRCGDGPDGVKPGEPGHDPAQVVALRQQELEASCAILGVDHLELLGYGDSGMMGWPSNDAPGAFWGTPVDEASPALVALIEKYRPDVVVTYDEYGFYGHPDHIQAHRVTMAAVAATDVPSKVYWTTAPRSLFDKMAAMMRELGAEWDEDPDAVQIGVPDDEVTTTVDVHAYIHQKFEALAVHASQSENIMFLQMGESKFDELMGAETFLRVRDKTGSPLPETDLFQGLR